jgi:hypothetical protein
VAQLGDHFLAGYTAASAMPAGDHTRLTQRVTLYGALSLLRRALRSWQKFKPDRLATALQLLEAETAAIAASTHPAAP